MAIPKKLPFHSSIEVKGLAGTPLPDLPVTFEKGASGAVLALVGYEPWQSKFLLTGDMWREVGGSYGQLRQEAQDALQKAYNEAESISITERVAILEEKVESLLKNPYKTSGIGERY